MNIVSGNFLGFSTSASWGDSNSHNNHSGGNKNHNSSNDVADPSRDEVMDQSRGDQEGESRDEERMEGNNRTKKINESAAHHDVSMFSTLTELLFNPFLDGYCKTPFCSDVDYLPPACPSGGLYTTPQHEARDYFSTSNKLNKHHHYDHHGSADEFGDINRSGSGASSGVGSSHRRKHRRPLALAVGYGDEWKDSEGRRVVITPSSSRRAHNNNMPANHRGGSPYLPYRGTAAHPATPSAPSTCTCSGQASSNSLVSPENDNIELSPHQTKAILCKYCTNRLRELHMPATSSSSGPISLPCPPLV